MILAHVNVIFDHTVLTSTTFTYSSLKNTDQDFMVEILFICIFWVKLVVAMAAKVLQ